jgi:hypothetical protein
LLQDVRSMERLDACADPDLGDLDQADSVKFFDGHIRIFPAARLEALGPAAILANSWKS